VALSWRESGRDLASPGLEEVLAVVAAEQEGEAGEVIAEHLDAVCRAAGEAGQGRAKLAGVGREPVIRELQQFGELDGVGGVRLVLGIVVLPSGVMADRVQRAWSSVAVMSSCRAFSA
jgi:hypothetical protein